MLARLSADLRADANKRAILLTGALLTLGAIILYLARAVGQDFSGEAFYDFQYPYRLSLFASWKVFFLDRIRSRLLHGVFISTLYHLYGFNPPLIYLTIYVFLILTAVIIALVISDFIKRPWLVGLLTAALALMPLNVPDMFQLKKAHHVLAWFLFWLSVLLLKKWFQVGKHAWLLLGTLAFLASVLTYEATVPLLPVAVLISFPLLHDFKDFLRKTGIVLFITLCVAFAFLRLEELKQYSSIGQVYPDFSNIQVSIGKALYLIPQVAASIWRGTLFASYIPATDWVLALIRTSLLLLFLIAMVGAVAAVRHPMKKKQINFGRFHSPQVSLFFAALYLSFATYLPFMLAGQAPDGDSLRGAAFALLFLAIGASASLHQWSLPRLAEGFLGMICLASICCGAANYSLALKQNRLDDHKLNNFIYTLKQRVPGVKAGTTFIFVNAQFSRTGCLGMMNMLYSKSDLQCIHLIDNDQQEHYTRVADGLLLRGGRLFLSNFIILTFDTNGNAILIDHITETDFPLLPLTWESKELIQTNSDVTLNPPESYGPNPNKQEESLIKELLRQKPSGFYQYVLKQRQKMGW